MQVITGSSAGSEHSYHCSVSMRCFLRTHKGQVSVGPREGGVTPVHETCSRPPTYLPPRTPWRTRRGPMVAVDWPGGRETKEYLGHKKKVHSLAWNCSGEKLASGSVDQSVRSASAAVLQPRLTHLAIVARWRRSILPKCPRCRGAVPTIPDHLPRWQVRLWALDPSGRSTGTELKGHQESVDQLRWDPKQPEVLGTASGDKTVRIWDTRSGKCSNVIETKGETHAASNRTPSRTPAPSPHPNPNHDPNPSRAPAQAKPQL
jgi:hypothetical protein